MQLKSHDFGGPVSLRAIVDGVWPEASDPCWIVFRHCDYLQEERTAAYVSFPKGSDPEAVKSMADSPYWLCGIVPTKWVLSAG
jgi:hypothetical protein